MQSNLQNSRPKRARFLTVNSEYSQSVEYNNTDFTIFLNNTEATQEKILRIIPKQMTIPHFFYNVNRFNNVLVVTETNTNTDIRITFPLMFYNYETWATTFRELYPKCTAVVVSPQGRLQITTTEPVAFDTNKTEMWRILGMQSRNENSTIVYSRPIPGLKHLTEFPGTILFNQPDEVYVYTSLADFHSIESNDLTTNLLDAVSLANTEYGQYCTKVYEDSNIYAIDFPEPRNVNRIAVVLRDKHGFPLTLPPNAIIDLQFTIFLA